MKTQAPIWQVYKLTGQTILSTLVMLAVICTICIGTSARAHEIRPAIADVTVDDTQLQLDIALTLESLGAGLDLTNLNDTNQSPLASRYDTLRALPPAQMEQAFRDAWPDVAAGFKIMAGDTPIMPILGAIHVDPIGDIELPRESYITLSADLPADQSPVTIGWESAFGPLVVRQVLDGEDGYSGYLVNGEISAPLPRSGSAQQPWLTSFVDYIVIGFEHIIPKGLDHILFVLGLFFFSLKLRPLLIQVTAFTLAHTTALALAILGYVQVPANIVEPLIAASIVYVALENVFQTQYRMSRTAVVFGFGLLHGLGFASVLGDIGLEPTRFLTGLIGFNIGVELGQLTVIAIAFATVGYWFGSKSWYRSRIAIPASLMIAAVAVYWVIERVFG